MEEEEINAPLTKDEIKEFKKLFKEDEFKIATGEATPLSILDLVPTKAGSILGTKMLRFFNKTLGKTRSYFRGIGKEGFEDALKYGVFRPKQADVSTKTMAGKIDISKTGAFNRDPITGQSRDTYVSGVGNIETGRGYGRSFDFSSGKKVETYPQYLAQFDNLKEVIAKQGGKLKYNRKKNVHYFTGDLPVDKSNARILKFIGPDDKLGTTVADFRKPLIGRLPIPTSTLTTDSKSKRYKPKRKYSFSKT